MQLIEKLLGLPGTGFAAAVPGASSAKTTASPLQIRQLQKEVHGTKKYAQLQMPVNVAIGDDQFKKHKLLKGCISPM
jgi:hypothetical protein